MEVDVLIVSDFRFPGGTSTSIVSEARALAAAGYRVGVMGLASAIFPARRGLHPGVQALIRDGVVNAVPVGVRVSARLCCLHHPAVFETLPAKGLEVDCDQAVLVVHHPPVDADGEPQYDIARIEAVLSLFFDRVDWAPVGPKVRDAFAALPFAPPLTEDDWLNVLDADDYRVSDARLPSSVPVIGRHSRPEPEKWPDDAETFLAAYPASPDVRVRLMGWSAVLDDIVETRPANWDVLPFGALDVRDFLGTLDYFSYFHSDAWVEAFGRSIIEAMAAGVVCLLPPDFEPLFGDAAIYCQPEDVLDQVKRLEADPEAKAVLIANAARAVRLSFGPEVAVARVRARIGAPSGGSVPARAARPASVVYLTSNGVGMGHITRCLATARRMSAAVKPTILTMSSAFEVARTQGVDVEYIPFLRSVGLEHGVWAPKARREIEMIFRYHRPDVFVFDGNVPYVALIEVLQGVPDVWKVWQRRALWPPEIGATALDETANFDAVLEPAEVAAPVDRGLTARRRLEAHVVPNVRFLDAEEALERGAAQKLIGLDPSRPAVLLQLGAGNNIDLQDATKALLDEIRRVGRGRVQIVFARWRISKTALELGEDVRVLDAFPISRFLNAFDCAVAMAGYNTFHENIAAALPTLFTANEHPEQDEQWLRSDFAAMRGLGLSARVDDGVGLRRAMRSLLDARVRDALRARCRSLALPNGAQAAADFIEGLTLMRKSSGLRFDQRLVAE